MNGDTGESSSSSAPASSRGEAAAWLREIARAEPVDLAAARVGTKLGRFELESVLGRGGMGVVFAAWDRTLGRAVAIKVLHARHVDRAERRLRFLREAKAAAAIDHPAVARLLEVGDQDGEVFLVMERVEGRSLRARLRDGRVPLVEAVAIVRAICAALRAAHEAGIVHRDLKPDNVMLGASGAVKVLDFGLAKLHVPESASKTSSTDVVTHEGQVLGTPGYMSPEQSLGHATDARSDVFALGVLTFEMLAGRRPFLGATDMETVVSTSRDPAPALRSLAPDVPRALAALVHRCLEKDAGLRPASIDAFAAALEQAMKPRPTTRTVLVVGGLAACIGGLFAALHLAMPRAATADPNASATADPNAGATADPNAGATADPNASATADPNASATAPVHPRGSPPSAPTHGDAPRPVKSGSASSHPRAARSAPSRPVQAPPVSASPAPPAAPRSSVPMFSDPSYAERK